MTKYLRLVTTRVKPVYFKVYNKSHRMIHYIDIQHELKNNLPITDQELERWATCALSLHPKPSEMTLRLVEPEEIQHLNHLYRDKNKPTNVLAFVSQQPQHVPMECTHVGDVIICPEVILHESETQSIAYEAHFAHILIHGVLHLLGHDHQFEDDTRRMQAHETTLLLQLGFPNPYQPVEDLNLEF